MCHFKQGAPTCAGLSAQAQLSRAEAGGAKKNWLETGIYVSYTPRPAAGHNTVH